METGNKCYRKLEICTCVHSKEQEQLRNKQINKNIYFFPLLLLRFRSEMSYKEIERQTNKISESSQAVVMRRIKNSRRTGTSI